MNINEDIKILLESYVKTILKEPNDGDGSPHSNLGGTTINIKQDPSLSILIYLLLNEHVERTSYRPPDDLVKEVLQTVERLREKNQHLQEEISTHLDSL